MEYPLVTAVMNKKLLNTENINIIIKSFPIIKTSFLRENGILPLILLNDCNKEIHCMVLKTCKKCNVSKDFKHPCLFYTFRIEKYLKSLHSLY